MDFAVLSEKLSARRFPGSRKGFSSVCIDSRKAEEGSLFVALSGSAEDGHRYVEAAFKQGAAGAMVSREKIEDPALELRALATRTGRELIAVENTLAGLQDAARIYLEQFPGLLRAGITGSAGKTTTKEIAAAMIGQEKRVIMNEGNLNSETGLPLSVFTARPAHEVGIFELGMNRRGEIGELAGVLKPQLALITGIGTAHIGILGSRGAIAEEKKNIFSYFTGKEKALIPDDDDCRDFLAEGLKGTVIFFGCGSFGELGAVRDRGLAGTEITWEGKTVLFGLPGTYNVKNALAAAALAREIPVSGEAIREGLASVKPLFGRGEILEGKITVIRDCYNANPESVMRVLEFCDSLDWPGRRVYVLGSMLELGDASREAHGTVGRALAASRADRVFLFGEECEAAAEAMEAAKKRIWFYANTFEELSGALEVYVRPGDLVLLKGSRGCALERLTGLLCEGAA
jgi:UDP-N-acetylmuramoyl-tripeptide--D-alanyl-D-alanine ligase